MSRIALAISAEKYELDGRLEKRLSEAGHDVLKVPLETGIGNGFFKGRSGSYPDVLVLDADIQSIRTVRQKPGSIELADYETVDLPPIEFLQTMRAGGVSIPILVISDEQGKRQDFDKIDIDRFLTADLGTNSIFAAITDLAIDADSEFNPHAGDYDEPNPSDNL